MNNNKFHIQHTPSAHNFCTELILRLRIWLSFHLDLRGRHHDSLETQNHRDGKDLKILAMDLEQAQLRILDFVEVEHFQTGQDVANRGQRGAQPIVRK